MGGVAWAGTAYYVDSSCTYNGTGLGQSCAAGAGALGAFNSFTSATSLATGDDVYIKRGTTTLSRLNVNWDGTASDYVEIAPYGTGADPIISGALTEAGAWTKEGATAIYAAPNADYANTHVVTIDGVRIREVVWNTNIATTAAAMTAGSYTFDNAGDKIYVWASDGTDPSDNLVEYGKLGDSGYCLAGITFGSPDHAHHYLWIHDIDFKMCNASAISLANAGVAVSNGTIIENCSFDLNGSSGISVGGTDMIVRNNTCTDSNSEASSIQPCIAIEGGTAAAPHGNMKIYGNTVTNTRNGSCFEMNHGVIDSFFYNNTCTNWVVNFVEVWDGSHRNRVFNNIGINNSYPFCTDYSSSGTGMYPEGKCRGNFSGGFMVNAGTASGSDDNLVYDNILVGSGNIQGAADGSDCSGMGTGGSGGSNNNYFLNNTIVNTDATRFSCIRQENATDTGNVFKNNICYVTGGNAGNIGIRFKTASDNTSDYNNVYVSGSGSFGMVDATAKTFADWKTATSQDTNTVTGDPLLDSNYDIPSNSPSYGTGVYTNLIYRSLSGRVDRGQFDSTTGVTIQ